MKAYRCAIADCQACEEYFGLEAVLSHFDLIFDLVCHFSDIVLFRHFVDVGFVCHFVDVEHCCLDAFCRLDSFGLFAFGNFASACDPPLLVGPESCFAWKDFHTFVDLATHSQRSSHVVARVLLGSRSGIGKLGGCCGESHVHQ